MSYLGYNHICVAFLSGHESDAWSGYAAQCQACVNALCAQVIANNSLWWLNRQWCKIALTCWLRVVGRALDLDHYLLPPPHNPHPGQPQPQPQPQDPAAEAADSSQTDARQSQVESNNMSVDTAHMLTA